MKHLQETADAGRDHIELAFNTRDYENQSHANKNVETRGFLSNDYNSTRPRSNYVQRITILLIFGLFGGLVIIMSVASATLDKVTNLKFPSTVTTAYPSLGLPGYEGYSWNDVVTQAAGKDVNIMMQAGLPSVHYYWITNYLAPKLLADYNIKVNFVNADPCPITGATGAVCKTPEIVTAIKQKVAQNSDMSSGAYDIVWINGVNFYNMKTNNLLYGPFSNKVPSSANFDFESDTLKYDFKVPTSGYEMPYGFAYNIFIYSVSTSAAAAGLTSSTVNTVLKIASWIKTTGNGKFTYTAPAKLLNSVVTTDNYEGSAFLKQAFYEVAGAGNAGSAAGTFCGTSAYRPSTISAATCAADLKYSYKDFTETDFSTIPAKYTTIAPYLFTFLRALETDLFTDPSYGGLNNNYPSSTTSLTTAFTADSIWVMNTYVATTPSTLKDANNNYVGKGYVLSTGILANSNFFAIPINAKNKLSALVAINYISSAAAMFQRKSGQLTNPTSWSQYQAYDSSANEFTSKGGNWNVAFDTVPTLTNCVDRATLVDAKIPEPSVAYATQLETDWYWCVFNYGNAPQSVAARCG